MNAATRDRMNACCLVMHSKAILRFARTYGHESLDALDDVFSTLQSGAGYGVNFCSPIYSEAWELIEAVGPDAAPQIAPFIQAYIERGS